MPSVATQTALSDLYGGSREASVHCDSTFARLALCVDVFFLFRGAAVRQHLLPGDASFICTSGQGTSVTRTGHHIMCDKMVRLKK